MKNMINEILQYKDPGNLALIIVDQTNNPVKDALVTVFDQNGDDIVAAGTTNEQGLLGFQKLAPERYKVRVSAVGYDLADTEIIVESGKLVIEDVKLESESKIMNIEVY
jgi:hypothetical protein